MNILFITEVAADAGSVSGASLRDTRLIELLKLFSNVNVVVNESGGSSKYRYLIDNEKPPSESVRNEIYSDLYDFIIISCFHHSPSLGYYAKIPYRKVIYFADSAYHIYRNYLNLKLKVISLALKWREGEVLKSGVKCAYLGSDEVKHIPKRLQKNAVIFPFFVKKHDVLFREDGHLLVVGDYAFPPNARCLSVIESNEEKFNYEIHVYGKNIPKIKKNYKNLIIKGYAKDVESVYSGARALLYPISYGTGVKNKVIEALSYGIPTIGYREAFTNLSGLADVAGCVVNSIEELIHVANNSIMMPKSIGAIGYVDEFLNEMKASAFVRDSIGSVIDA